MIFRVYGDNIIECIRVIDLIKTNTIAKVNLELSFLSASSVVAKGTIDGKRPKLFWFQDLINRQNKDGKKTF